MNKIVLDQLNVVVINPKCDYDNVYVRYEYDVKPDKRTRFYLKILVGCDDKDKCRFRMTMVFDIYYDENLNVKQIIDMALNNIVLPMSIIIASVDRITDDNEEERLS
jgi:hypothetical protein